MNSPVSVLLVGSGSMAKRHAAALSVIPDVRIAAVASPDARSARALAAAHHADSFPTLDVGLRASRPDAVFICTPTDTHVPLIERAAAAGVEVFCEKPVSCDLRDAERGIRACARRSVTLMIGHVLRFFPEFKRLRELVLAGRLGRPAVARLSRGGKAPAGWKGWYARPRRSGGLLMDLAVHDFDWLRWTFGPLVRVQSRLSRHDGLSYALTLLRHRSGPISHVENFWGHGLPFRATAEVAGSDGLVTYDSDQPAALCLSAAPQRSSHPPITTPHSPRAKSPLQIQDEHFIDCVRRRTPPDVSPEDAFQALRVCLAAARSAQTGQAVKL